MQQSFKTSSWIWSINSRVVTVLRRGRGASQVEKSPRLDWATQFLTVAYDDACSPNVYFRMAWISFGALPCREKKLMTVRVSMLLNSRAWPDMLPFSLCNKKRLAIRHMNRPFFPMTLSIPSYDIGKYVGLRPYQHPLVKAAVRHTMAMQHLTRGTWDIKIMQPLFHMVVNNEYSVYTNAF